jgi:hypothetical protein
MSFKFTDKTIKHGAASNQQFITRNVMETKAPRGAPMIRMGWHSKTGVYAVSGVEHTFMPITVFDMFNEKCVVVLTDPQSRAAVFCSTLLLLFYLGIGRMPSATELYAHGYAFAPFIVRLGVLCMELVRHLASPKLPHDSRVALAQYLQVLCLGMREFLGKSAMPSLKDSSTQLPRDVDKNFSDPVAIIVCYCVKQFGDNTKTSMTVFLRMMMSYMWQRVSFINDAQGDALRAIVRVGLPADCTKPTHQFSKCSNPKLLKAAVRKFQPEGDAVQPDSVVPTTGASAGQGNIRLSPCENFATGTVCMVNNNKTNHFECLMHPTGPVAQSSASWRRRDGTLCAALVLLKLAHDEIVFVNIYTEDGTDVTSSFLFVTQQPVTVKEGIGTMHTVNNPAHLKNFKEGITRVTTMGNSGFIVLNGTLPSTVPDQRFFTKVTRAEPVGTIVTHTEPVATSGTRAEPAATSGGGNKPPLVVKETRGNRSELRAEAEKGLTASVKKWAATEKEEPVEMPPWMNGDSVADSVADFDDSAIQRAIATAEEELNIACSNSNKARNNHNNAKSNRLVARSNNCNTPGYTGSLVAAADTAVGTTQEQLACAVITEEVATGNLEQLKMERQVQLEQCKARHQNSESHDIPFPPWMDDAADAADAASIPLIQYVDDLLGVNNNNKCIEHCAAAARAGHRHCAAVARTFERDHAAAVKFVADAQEHAQIAADDAEVQLAVAKLANKNASEFHVQCLKMHSISTCPAMTRQFAQEAATASNNAKAELTCARSAVEKANREWNSAKAHYNTIVTKMAIAKRMAAHGGGGGGGGGGGASKR